MRSSRFNPAAAWGCALLATAAAAAQGGDAANAPMVVPETSVQVEVGLPPAEPAGTARDPGLPIERTPLGPEPVVGAGPERPLVPAGPELLRVGVALAVVLGLLLTLRLCVRRVAGPLSGGGRPSGVLEILARYPVGRGQQLLLLKLVGRVVLLHQGRGALTTLTEVTDPNEVAALLAALESGQRPSIATGFQGMLQRVAGRPATPGDDFPPSPDRAVTQAVEQKVLVDLTRRPPRGRRSWTKGRWS